MAPRSAVPALKAAFGLSALLLVASLPSTANAQSATCDDLRDACFDEDTCTSCVEAVEDNLLSASTDCGLRYPESTSFCELVGASYCCIFDESSAAECASDQTTRNYWDCVLGEFGCGVEDMPCNGDSPTPVTSPVPAPVTPAAPDGEFQSVAEPAPPPSPPCRFVPRERGRPAWMSY